jgi:hypothetical protein
MVFAGSVVGLPAVAASESSIGARLHVVVRAYDNGLLAAADRQIVLSGAHDILANGAIDIEWLSCGLDNRSPATCNERLEPDEFSLRLVHLHTPQRFLGKLPLGYSLVDTYRRTGSLATIYLDRVVWLAQSAHADPLRLMGRAIAHEIGHLLLGRNEHSACGLMRAVWDREELRHEDEQDWQLTSADASAMRAAFSARAAATLLAKNGAWETK